MKVKVILGLAFLVAAARSAPLRNTLDLLELQIEQYHDQVRTQTGPLEGFDNATDKYKDMLKKLKESTKWICTNGKDPKSLSN